MELSVAPTPSWLCQAELLDRLGKKGSGRRSTDILAAAGLQTVFLTEFYTASLQTLLTPTAPNPNIFFFGYTINTLKKTIYPVGPHSNPPDNPLTSSASRHLTSPCFHQARLMSPARFHH